MHMVSACVCICVYKCAHMHSHMYGDQGSCDFLYCIHQVTSAIQLFTFNLHARLCRHTHAMVRMWRSEDTFQELVPAFYLVEVRSLLWFLPSFLQPGYQAREVPSNPPVSGSLLPARVLGLPSPTSLSTSAKAVYPPDRHSLLNHHQ